MSHICSSSCKPFHAHTFTEKSAVSQMQQYERIPTLRHKSIDSYESEIKSLLDLRKNPPVPKFPRPTFKYPKLNSLSNKV